MNALTRPCEGARDDSGPELLGDALERVQVEQALQVTQQYEAQLRMDAEQREREPERGEERAREPEPPQRTTNSSKQWIEQQEDEWAEAMSLEKTAASTPTPSRRRRRTSRSRCWASASTR